jgi:hypothetical protein
MKLRESLFAAVGALIVSAFAVPANAAPIAGGVQSLPEGMQAGIDKVHYGRGCWRHRGHWHCRRTVRRYYHSYGYAPYAYGPSFGFYFGGGRHGHWGHRGHRW